ncbi:glycosyltransferase family 2 protein [Frigoribacterium sp. CFBP 13605]|uniref:glycosyltransferase family 2 protein n=1 Tax=Frigoribacterium sp. CFBP 13605 TaxID=2774034 RepID=UPI0019043792|nr:glycosyltransferase family 2 protein [Frigoribacterium sp. CFBP 13605]MBD8139236.1 glycosyltransferase family 2 protein [Frigoribacterium sp. CFBP 13605]
MTTPTRSDEPTVAIVTVSYNSGRYLSAFLASTESASAEPTRLVVADNASTDVDAARTTTEGAGGRFVEVGANRGYGTAVNRAVTHLPSSVHHVLISNPDVVLAPGVVDVLLDTLRSGDDIAAVGPAIVEADGEPYPSARQIPSLRTGLGHALFANLWPTNPWSRSYRREGEHEARRDTGWLSGACLLVRRDVFDELGGFDERYFMYFEDVDLGYRIGLSGRRSVYEPAATVVHVGAHSTRESSDAMRREHHRSAYRFLASKYRAWYLWPVRAALRVALEARFRLGGLPRRASTPNPTGKR